VRLKIIDGSLVPSRIPAIIGLKLLLAMMHSIFGRLTKLQVLRGRRHAAEQRWVVK